MKLALDANTFVVAIEFRISYLPFNRTSTYLE